MSFPEGESEGQEEGSVREEFIGRGRTGRGPYRDVQYELSSRAAFRRDSSRNDGENQDPGAVTSKEIESRRWKVECGE